MTEPMTVVDLRSQNAEFQVARPGIRSQGRKTPLPCPPLPYPIGVTFLQHCCKYATTSFIDPWTKCPMSSILDPWISNDFPPSNKNRSLSLGLDARKKLTPLHWLYLICQAICDFCIVILLFFIIFNSMKNTFPFMQINVSGIPSPTLFSILW